ncbi:beta-propeller fold lactonase family protein [Desulfosarcina sp.]|uniref:beta-propeller fold lactonase family protein n=1 Tax=Desulfosarcina sp. TaxID=2027861 RepID=UPI0035634474
MKHTVSVSISAILIGLCAASALYAETTAYMANGGVDEVLKVTASSEAVVTTPLSDTPYGVAVTPDGEQVLVTQNGGDAVAFISTSNFSGSPFTLAVGRFPRGVAVDPTGRYAYVANFGDDTVSKISVSGRNVTDTITVENGPWGVAARFDEQNDSPVVYVACNTDDSVTVIDKDNQKTIINVGDGPAGLAVTPDGGDVYVANNNDDTVSVIDTFTNTVIDTVTVGSAPWGIAVGAEGKYVYVSNSDADTVTVIQTADRSIVRTYLVGDTPRGVSAPRNGTFAYVVNQGDGSISRIDMDDETVTELAAGLIDDAYSMGAFFGDRPPATPSGLEAEPRNTNTIDLRWTDESTDEWGFRIERSRENEDNYVHIANVDENSTTYEDFNLFSNTVYFYRIRAYNEAADSVHSVSISAATERHSGYVWCFINTVIR